MEHFHSVLAFNWSIRLHVNIPDPEGHMQQHELVGEKKEWSTNKTKQKSLNSKSDNDYTFSKRELLQLYLSHIHAFYYTLSFTVLTLRDNKIEVLVMKTYASLLFFHTDN